MTSRTISDRFKANILPLSTARTDWTEQFENDLISRIDMQLKPVWGLIRKKSSGMPVLRLIQSKCLPGGMSHFSKHKLMMISETTRKKGMSC